MKRNENISKTYQIYKINEKSIKILKTIKIN